MLERLFVLVAAIAVLALPVSSATAAPGKNIVEKAGLAGVLSGKTKVLLYHALLGKAPAGKVMKMKSAKTAEGSKATFSVRGGSAFVNDAKITRTGIRCSNGIIHAINGVLLPPES